MPPRKKGFNNKKKGRNVKSNHAPPSTADASRGDDPSRASLLPDVTPDFSEYKQRSPISKNYGTIYTRYKEATHRFYDFMMDQTPEDVRGKPCVNALVPSTDWMLEQQVTIPKSVLTDLKMAIRTRDRVAKSVFGGGDEGHKYFLSVLLYCWTILIALPRSESVRPTDDESEGEADESNRYAVLAEEIDDDEDAESDSDFSPSSPVARPQPHSESMTLKELLDADDLHDATLFLLNLEELMGFVVNQYQAVAKVYNIHTDVDGNTSSALINTVLQAAVATNMAIQQVHALEMALQAQHPHLSTPYQVLSAMVFPEVAQSFTRTLKEHTAKKCSEQEILAHMGDCLECGFRNPSDTLNRKDTIANDFCAAFGVDAEATSPIEEMVGKLGSLVLMEVPIGQREREEAAKRRNRAGSEAHSPSWLRNLKFIGGDRSIIHTIRLLQWFGPAIHAPADSYSIHLFFGEFFGPPGQPGQRKTTHGELDAMLMCEIIPQWKIMCSAGIIGRGKLPFEHELYPLFVALRDYVKSPIKAVSWSLAFAVHASVTAIVETADIVDKLAVLQKFVFDNYFDNVEWALKSGQTEEGLRRNKAFVHNMSVMSFLKNLSHDAFDRQTLWNPLCGGTILSYVAYFGNLKMGCALVDCNAQLRITLHLFNALLVNGLIKQGQVPFLDSLHSTFKSSRGVWEGPLPERGQFVQRFWICNGMSPQDAKQAADLARRDFQGGRAGRQSSSCLSDGVTPLRLRKMNPIDPAQISISYRRLCNQDFRGAQDNYCTPEQRRRSRGTEIYAHCVRSNDTTDAIYAEQVQLCFHWPCCGVILEQFVSNLNRVNQWEPLRSDLASRSMGDNKQIAFVFLFAQQLLGALDFAKAPEEHIFLGQPTVQTPAQILSTYFGQVDETKVLWF